jgi:hypothetical protein
MSKKAFDKIAEGLTEAIAVARGIAKPYALYVPPEMSAGQATFEMSNLRPDTTGLPFVVWVSQKEGVFP